MGRAKFKINLDIDSMNMFFYMRKIKALICNEFCKSKNIDFNKIPQNEECMYFNNLLDNLCSINYRLTGNLTEDQYKNKQTELLYLLSEERRNKIRITLRAKRKDNNEKNKKQLTINADVHHKLRMYAKDSKMTLSDAIQDLLEMKV